MNFESLKSFPRGASQVMFQPNAATGVLFLAGILWNALAGGHTETAVGALVGLVVSTLAGCLLRLPADEGSIGLWGFNGILLGVAAMTFLGNTPLGWVALILFSALTTLVRTALNRVGSSHGINSLTFPFVLCCWIMLSASRLFAGLEDVALSHPMLPALHRSDLAATPPANVLEGARWVLRGVAQIMLCEHWVSGFMFVVGLLLSSPWAALWALVGSAVGTFGALVFGGSAVATQTGLYGYSSALTAIALGCTFYHPTWLSSLWALLGSVATLFIQAALNLFLEPWGLPALTAPFCLATWLFLLPRFRLDSRTLETDHSNWHTKTSHNH